MRFRREAIVDFLWNAIRILICLHESEFWKAECRLTSFSVYVPVERIVEPDALPQVPSMFGKAVYELRLTPGR